eukprot:CAMPEP_0202949170 /NCGR_PEP_ID=MMETSP1395-20130829/15080_1 /ASSEMBLY_ACC=CAM_ASM_000871 /TAXON_ID=5961 /ORGANISM="Blepharisma japonicum, Strain Stock R1072" /LENGTH=50 /DNA_ID=CAMNT_0049651965 /DNA_START=392 /DNA_END=544 /DNA_ORIENTATION=+
MEALETIKSMGKGHIFFQMEEAMQEAELMAKCTEKDYLSLQMVEDMKETM